MRDSLLNPTHHLSLCVMPSYQSPSSVLMLIMGSGHRDGVTFRKEP